MYISYLYIKVIIILKDAKTFPEKTFSEIESFRDIKEIDPSVKDEILKLLQAEKEHNYKISPQRLEELFYSIEELVCSLESKSDILGRLSSLIKEGAISIEKYGNLCENLFNHPYIEKEHIIGLLDILQSEKISRENKDRIIVSLTKTHPFCHTDPVALCDLLHTRSPYRESFSEFLEKSEDIGKILSDISTQKRAIIFGKMLTKWGGEVTGNLMSLYVDFEKFENFYNLHQSRDFDNPISIELASYLSTLLYTTIDITKDNDKVLLKILVNHYVYENNHNEKQIGTGHINPNITDLIDIFIKKDIQFNEKNCDKLIQIGLISFISKSDFKNKDEINADTVNKRVEEIYDDYQRSRQK